MIFDILNEKSITKKLFTENPLYSTSKIELPNYLVAYWCSMGLSFQNNFDITLQNGVSSYILWWFKHNNNVCLSKDCFTYFHEKYNRVSLTNMKKITLLMKLIWNNRLDLQESFPNVEEDSSGYWNWWKNHGAQEYNL